MQCRDFQRRVHLLLDRRLRPERDGELVAHTYVCADCSDLMETQSLLFDGLELGVATSDCDLPQRVVSRLQLERPRSKRTIPTVLLSLAAALMLAAMPLASYLSSSPARPEVALAVVHPQSDAAWTMDMASVDTAAVSLSTLSELSFSRSTHVAYGFQPLASTFSAAFDALRRAISAPFQPPPESSNSALLPMVF